MALTSLTLLARQRSRFAAPPCGAALIELFAIAAWADGRPTFTTLGDPDVAIRAIAGMGGGFVTILAVADAWLRKRAIPTHLELAADFRISGTQVCKIIRLAAHHQLVDMGRNGKIVDASALVVAVRRLVAQELALYTPITRGLPRTRCARTPVVVVDSSASSECLQFPTELARRSNMKSATGPDFMSTT